MSHNLLVDKETKKMMFLGVASFLFFLLYRDNYALGDSLIYADNILRMRFDDISLHMGYYFLGYLFHLVLETVTIGIDQTLIVMSCIFGSLGVIYSYLFIARLFGDSRVAFLGSILLMFSGSYLSYSMTAEVYILQTFFIMASMYHFLNRQAIISGVLFAIAILITPLSAFCSVYFLYIYLTRKYEFKVLLTFVVSCLVVFLPLFFPVYEEYLWGRRGLLRIGMAASMVGITQVFKNIVLTLGKSFHLFVIMALPGYVYMYSRYRDKFWLFVALNLLHIYLVLMATESATLETFLLPTFFTYSVAIALGLIVSLEKLKIFSGIIANRVAITTLTVLFCAMSLVIRLGTERILDPHFLSDTSYQNELTELGNSLTANDILITSFWDGIAFAFYTRNDNSEELEASMGNRRWMDIQFLNARTLSEIAQSRNHVYVMESYSAGPGARLFYSEEELAARFESYSIRAHVSRLGPGLLLEEFMDGKSTQFYKVSVKAEHGNSLR